MIKKTKLFKSMHNQLFKEYEYIIWKLNHFTHRAKTIKQSGIPYSSLKIFVHSPKDSSHPLLHLKRNKKFTKTIIYKREMIEILLSNSWIAMALIFLIYLYNEWTVWASLLIFATWNFPRKETSISLKSCIVLGKYQRRR